MPMISAAMSMSRIAIHCAPDAAAHQVLRNQREEEHDGQDEEVFGARIDASAPVT